MKIRDEIALIKTDSNSLRSFGWIVGGIFAVIGLLPALRHGIAFNFWLILGLSLITLGTVAPRLLKWVYIIWMGFGFVMSKIISPVLFTVLYLLTFFPMAVIMRLFGKRFLNLDFRNEADTYWIKKKKKENVSKDAENQF